jgi:flagellar basal body-associated protein FliL
MAEKDEKPAKEETKEKSGGGNGIVVGAVMLTGLLNTGAIAGLGYFLSTRPVTVAAPAAGAKPAGEGGDAAAHGEGGGEAGGEHGGEAHADSGGGGGDHGGGDGDHGGGKKEHGPPGVVEQLQNIVVRLKDVEREHHARISLALEFKPTMEKAAIEASMPRVREATIRYASDRRYDEMRGSRGLLDLKKFLNKEARTLFGADFSELYVTEFVAQ